MLAKRFANQIIDRFDWSHRRSFHRFFAPSTIKKRIFALGLCSVPAHVRFGSKADVRTAKGHVRFTPESDRESRHVPMVMSALSPKADVCAALADVCYGPEADMTTSLKVSIVILRRLVLQRFERQERNPSEDQAQSQRRPFVRSIG